LWLKQSLWKKSRGDYEKRHLLKQDRVEKALKRRKVENQNQNHGGGKIREATDFLGEGSEVMTDEKGKNLGL